MVYFDNIFCMSCKNCLKSNKSICVVVNYKNALQLTHSLHDFSGTYHILGSTISPAKNQSIDINRLLDRITENTQEVIITCDATVEGDATAHFIRHACDQLKQQKNYSLEVTRLSFGLPMGNALEYVDGVTISYAFNSRKQF